MSRRFKGRHARVQADPHALPAPPVVLDDSNSYVDVTQPDTRRPLTLVGRRFATAGELDADDYVEVTEPAAPPVVETNAQKLARLTALVAANTAAERALQAEINGQA